MSSAAFVPDPSSIEDVTIDWLHSAMPATAFKGRTVKTLQINPIGVGQGFLSSIFKLTVVFAEEEGVGPMDIVFKLLPSDPEASAFVCENQLHLREANFYRLLSDDPRLCAVRACAPSSLLTSPNALVIEHVSGTVLPIERSLTLDGLQQVFGALGLLHNPFWTPAASLDSESPTPLLTGFNPQRTEGLLLSCFHSTPELELLLEALHAVHSQQVLDKAFGAAITADQVARTVDAFAGRSYCGVRTAVHGDLWSGNILWRPSPCLVDWQFVGFSNPALDLALLLCSSCDPALYLTRAARQSLWEVYLAAHRSIPQGRPVAWLADDVETAFIHALPYVWLILMASVTAWVRPTTLTIVANRYAAVLSLLIEHGSFTLN